MGVASVLRLAWFGGRLFGTLLASSLIVCLAATPQTHDPRFLADHAKHSDDNYSRYTMSTWGIGDDHDSDEVYTLKDQLRAKG